MAVMGAGASVTPQGLKFLIRLCTDLGLAKEAQDYAVKLKKVEKVFVICVCCLVLLCPCLLKLLPCGLPPQAAAVWSTQLHTYLLLCPFLPRAA